MNTTKTKTPEIVQEDYRGHRIGTAMKNVDAKNPISGHEWSDRVATNRFSVAVIEGCDTPTRPARPWRLCRFTTMANAKKEVDAQIRLSMIIAQEMHRQGVPPDDTHFQQAWRRNVLAELAGQAKATIAATPQVRLGIPNVP